jgi:hypothetical protein
MKTIHLLLSTMVVGFALMLAATAPAVAQGCNCGTILQYHRDTQRIIGDKIDESATRIIRALTGQDENYNLIDALQGHAAETGAHIDRTVEASERIEDAAQLNETKRLRDEFRARAESGDFDPNPVACLLMDLFSGSGGTGGQQGGVGGMNGSDVMNAAVEWGSGNHPAIQAGGTALGKYIVDRDLALGGKSTDWSLVFENPTMDMEGDNGEAIARMTETLFYPAPPRPLTASELETPAGLAEAARREYVDDVISMAQRGVAFGMNMRAAVGPSAPYKVIVDDQIAKGAYTTPLGDTISELQQLEIRTLARYAPSEQAVLDRQNMNQKALLMELIDQMALSNRMQYMQLNLDSTNAGTLAAITSLLAQGRTGNIAAQ